MKGVELIYAKTMNVQKTSFVIVTSSQVVVDITVFAVACVAKFFARRPFTST